MKICSSNPLAFALTLIISAVGVAQATSDPFTPVCQIDWERFLARHDPVWNTVPATWDDSVFLGNGLMGALIYTNGRNELGWGIGRTDVTDHQQGPEPLLRTPRLPIGRLVLEPVGRSKAAPHALIFGMPQPTAWSAPTKVRSIGTPLYTQRRWSWSLPWRRLRGEAGVDLQQPPRHMA